MSVHGGLGYFAALVALLDPQINLTLIRYEFLLGVDCHGVVDLLDFQLVARLEQVVDFLVVYLDVRDSVYNETKHTGTSHALVSNFHPDLWLFYLN